ncbi:MAG: hypothetical protein ACREUV_03880 [Burkholderiales bacterium]
MRANICMRFFLKAGEDGGNIVTLFSLCYKLRGMKNGIHLMALAAVVLPGFISACSSNPTLATSAPVENTEPGKFQPLTDIPIPAGAKLDTEPSLILGPPDHWLGRAVLKVGISANDTTVFYQNQMPAFGWELITLVQGKINNLTFSKADRIASIQIEAAALGGANVVIIMSPRQPGQAAKPGK